MIWMWLGFILFVLAMLALDLGVFHRKAHVVRVREALVWSAVWITIALFFNAFVYFAYDNHWLGIGRDSTGAVKIDPVDHVQLDGRSAAIKFFTGYVIEKSLSVDNIFVIALIFAYFKIPGMYQHRVLFWGILGALIMRGMFIALGAALIARAHWILYVFGAFLIYTAWKMLTSDQDPDPQNNPIIKFVHKHFPITKELHGQKFLIKRSELAPGEALDAPETETATETAAETTAETTTTTSPVAAAPGASTPTPAGTSALILTPLALTLIVVEFTDLIFAVDSIPAIFAITGEPFIVFTSNVFAILGLRALYFALAGILGKFHYLQVSLAIVLGLVGVKMLAADYLKKFEFFKNNLSFITLGVIAVILAAGVIASLIWTRNDDDEESKSPEPSKRSDPSDPSDPSPRTDLT